MTLSSQTTLLAQADTLEAPQWPAMEQTETSPPIIAGDAPFPEGAAPLPEDAVPQASQGDNPWAAMSGSGSGAGSSAEPAAAADNPWGTLSGQSQPADAGSTDWLSASAAAGDVLDGFQIRQLWDGSLPVQSWINDGLGWFVAAFRPFFQSIRQPIDSVLGTVEQLLLSVPTLAMIAIFTLLAWQFAGRVIAVGSMVSLLLIAMLGIWPESMITLALVLTSLLFCLVIGLPLGILLASSDRAQRIGRPVLDAMQTTPAFVYLVPVVMLFGIGNVPGVIVTIVFALPPLVRLTNLGIRQVRPDLIEAARAYGISPIQLLGKVQLPLAMPSIMAGINQALMLSLSMVVIASMIAVGGLGQMVLRGIGRLDMGLATVGGIGIVLLAIILDRITQSLGQPRRGGRSWLDNGPIGLLRALLARRNRASVKKESMAPVAVAGHPAGAAPARLPTGSEPLPGKARSRPRPA